MLLRVLFVTHKYAPQKGGVAVSASRIVKGLVGWCSGVHVLHATREQEPALVQSREEDEVTVFTMGETDRGAESGQLLETTIRALHQQNSYDVIIGFYAVPTGYQAVFTAAFLGLPSLLCLRGNDVDRAIYHEGQAASLRWALERATRVVGVSRELVHKAALFSGRNDIEFIANSVDSEEFYPEPGKAIPGRLLFCGEMRLKKGSSLLFHALEELIGDWSLTVVRGFRGRAEADYRRWSLRNRETASRIQLLPYQRDVPRLRNLYNQAALVLNPALWDGMPNSVLEAMACGRPVLSTNVGGVKDLVQNQETGHLLQLNELEQMAQKIQQLLHSPDLESVGPNARQFVQQNHSPQREAQEFRRVLEQVVG